MTINTLVLVCTQIASTAFLFGTMVQRVRDLERRVSRLEKLQNREFSANAGR